MRTIIITLHTDSDDVATEAMRTMLDALPPDVRPYRAWQQKAEPEPEPVRGADPAP